MAPLPIPRAVMGLAWFVLGTYGWQPAVLPRLAPSASRLAGPPRLSAEPSETDAEKRKRMQQLFGDNFQDETARELARSTKVEQPKKAEQPPDWMQPAPEDDEALRDWDMQRMALWLDDRGVNMDKVMLVKADEGRLVLVTTAAVAAGEALFDVPDKLLLTAETAFGDPFVGRDLRIMATKGQGSATEKLGDGFDTFAIAAMLAVERVQRGAVRGKLRRQDAGILGGGKRDAKWSVSKTADMQSNREFSPFVATLGWPSDDECLVDTSERADAVSEGSELIAKLVEPAARVAWMRATQGKGLAQATSEEDVRCTAVQALVLTMEVQMDPPPPLGNPTGATGWGGNVRNGPAICPLVNLVLPPADAKPSTIQELRAAGAFNAHLGRPSTGSVDSAIRCVASKDLPAGTAIFSDVPGAAMASAAATVAPGSRVRVVRGPLTGRTGKVITLRPQDRKPIVRLEGGDEKLVVLPASAIESTEAAPLSSAAPEAAPARRRSLM